MQSIEGGKDVITPAATVLSPALARVKRAAQNRRRAESEYRAALLAARESHSLAEIAAVAGIHRQTVAYFTRVPVE